jgi:hypothetical protein
MNETKPLMMGILGWFLPGFGHIWQGATRRGAVVGVCIWLMFLIGFFSGGLSFPGHGAEAGIMTWLHNFATIGNGAGFLLNWVLNNGGNAEAAKLLTFEYGGKFLEGAGLLNFLAALHAYDLGRKINK